MLPLSLGWKSLLVLCFTVLGASSSVINTTVALDYGTFTGLQDEDAGIIYFRGIAFSDPPVNDLRWRAPVFPPSNHLGNVDATQFGDVCIETATSTVPSGASEDCLFINVNIPIGTDTADKLPVLIYFHGGGFQSGSSIGFPPNALFQSSAKPFIYASSQYRLGQFGFLGGSKLKANGALNAGLLDQRAALRWLQKYISHFGGDPKRVTIWGESAGAGSTMFQVVANGGDTEGLFVAAMGDSPSMSFTPAFDSVYVEGIFTDFAVNVGCDPDKDPMTCLREADVNDLTAAGNKVLASKPTTIFSFAPILDGSFISKRPVEAFRERTFAQIPLFYGSNTNEGADWSSNIAAPWANTRTPNATEDTVYFFLQGQYHTFTNESFVKALELYPLADYSNSFDLQGQQMYGEMRYICTAILITEAAKQSGLDAFQYRYDNPHLGSNHGADLAALFPSSSSSANADDLALFEAMREYWTSFATGGTPMAQNEPEWTAKGNPRMLLHPGGIHLENITDALSARCNFWHGLKEEIKI
ncbi:Alpha/Beta hydrolase protein [Desarmillaria tabescens]|uniref:Carboxylic ester hydrolase n=1 Tax=Armillaria tabescens TaxID=1929756 RepID=A0AA39JW62_ARMTA|nr:Alpha/Beta hydrolase protein [Desarmillaria tabescens]KAK0449727.1 Alpha/Beta hydrolase protein [Desarmillaria tabescens]